MGHAYEFRFTEANEKYTESNEIHPTPEAIAAILRSAPGFSRKREDVYYFESRQESIDASASFRPFGIQLCLHNTPYQGTDKLLNYLMYRVIDDFASVEIIELGLSYARIVPFSRSLPSRHTSSIVAFAQVK